MAASSKPAAVEWISRDVHIDQVSETTEDACYRAMDELLGIESQQPAEQVYFRVTDLLNLEVDLLFFDTTYTYVELDEADAELPRDSGGRVVAEGDPTAVTSGGFRSWGESRDGRDDVPQVVVVGMAETRDEILVRVVLARGTAGSKLIRQVKQDMRAWSPSRIVWVAGRSFSLADNRRELMRGAGGYIIGEKLRSGSQEVEAALSRQGRYATVRENLQVKGSQHRQQ